MSRCFLRGLSGYQRYPARAGAFRWSLTIPVATALRHRVRAPLPASQIDHWSILMRHATSIDHRQDAS